MRSFLNNTLGKSASAIAIAAIVFGTFGFSLGASVPVAHAAAAPNWDASGTYVINENYLGTDYPHDMTLTQDGSGNLTGNGGSPAGTDTYTWVITSGSVSGDSIDFLANYTATPDAVTPQTVLHLTGTIAPDGTISGTWSDNYQGGDRSGTVATVSGAATALPGSLSAQDFGVMDQSGVKGYTAGFGLTDATFSGAQSVVMQLYSGATLLQTNTATALVGTTITGSDISSPFDVFGTFDYAADGYWTNVRGTEYGQTLIPTKVVATVTLANGKVVTAENDNLTGDPTTIFPPPAAPTVSSLSMATGTTSGGDSVIITGTGLGGATAVNFGSTTASISADTDTSITATSPAGTGTVDVTVTTANGTSATSTADQFTYVLSGTVTGDQGTLAVTSIDSTKTSATADGTFANGWIYTFHVTVPLNEPNVAMKFADWVNNTPPGTIPVAGNMRISSAQADNAGATVLLSAANTYSTPSLHITGDLDPTTPGMQVAITVEVAVPVNTTNGSYTTSYGVQTLP